MKGRQKNVSPQADLIANRAIFLLRDRWPTIYNSLTNECLHSLRAIVSNDVDCLLKALGGDQSAQEAFALLEKGLADQKLAIDERREYFTARKERMRNRYDGS